MYNFSLLASIITIVVVISAILGACAYLILVERKIAAYVQDRIGPNRVGPFGLLQPLADGLKFLFKEDIIPAHVDKVLFLAAPAVAVSAALLGFVIVPFGPTTVPPAPPVAPPAQANQQEAQAYLRAREEYLNSPAVKEYAATYQFVIAPHVNIGIVLLFAITSLAVYAIILGGWSSNSKYSMLGGLRSSAQFISYEIPMGMSVLGVVLLSGSLNFEQIVQRQADSGCWFIFFQPLAFVLFLTAAFAECNRLPFDLPEAEQELVGGYHTEYSAMKFALFFLGEYAHMITTSFVMASLFLGGWHFWGLPETGPAAIVLRLLVFSFKMVCFIVFFMFIRWTIPRFRFDQLMHLAWKVLIPLALVNVVCVMIVKEMGWSPWWLLLTSIVTLIAGALPVLFVRPTPRRSVVVLQQPGTRLQPSPR